MRPAASTAAEPGDLASRGRAARAGGATPRWADARPVDESVFPATIAGPRSSAPPPGTDFGHEDAVRGVARADVRRLTKLRPARRRHEQQHGKGGLGDQQSFAQSPRSQAAKAARAGAVAAVQRLGQVEAGAAKRRSQPREDGRDERRRGGERDGRSVEADGVEAWKIARHHHRGDADHRPRSASPRARCQAPTARRSRSELARQAAAASRRWRPARSVGCAARGRATEKVGDVRAGNQQQAPTAPARINRAGRTRGHLVGKAADVDDRRPPTPNSRLGGHRAEPS